jgi:hypothetical protein
MFKERRVIEEGRFDWKAIKSDRKWSKVTITLDSKCLALVESEQEKMIGARWPLVVFICSVQMSECFCVEPSQRNLEHFVAIESGGKEQGRDFLKIDES